jgi:hypothetical protein
MNSNEIKTGEKQPDAVIEINPQPLDGLEHPKVEVIFEDTGVASSTDIINFPISKTPRMRALENQLNEPIEDVLYRLYDREKHSIRELTHVLGVDDQTIVSWLKRVHIPQRTQEESTRLAASKSKRVTPLTRDTESGRKRIASLKRTWQQRHTELNARVHSPEVDKRRLQTKRQKYASDPNTLQRVRDVAKKAHEASMESLQERRRTAFGDNIQQKLQRMIYGEGMSIDEIEELTGFSKDTLYRMCEQSNISLRLHHSRDTLDAYMDINTRLWENPATLQVLSEKEKEIITSRFLNEDRIPSLEDIAREKGVTRQSIQKIEKRALRKLGSAH